MTVRCAIYTRKSTEEGLEQDFNSLDAQREACEAYVQSQKGLGWVVQKKHYDDGGISGGTLDRPALQALLLDIEQGRVDLVVVYKVDRLTRSLMDFSKIIETFDAQNISFVSVTQQFNTANSMGRLTLNVLLSFAQFEREVTTERIRDKIAASKKKGMWMGGPLPLGYEVNDRKLIANETEAMTVRQIFRLYTKLGAVRELKEELDRRSIVTKYRIQKNGKQTGGKLFSRGNLYQLLSNPIYIGRIPHKGETYPGEHDAIIDQNTWETAQALLAGNATIRTQTTNIKGSFLLTGKIFDENDKPLYQSQAHKHGKHYGYYISKHLMHGAHENNVGWRIPAKTMEEAVVASLLNMFRSQSRLMDIMCLQDPSINSLTMLKMQAAKLTQQLEEGNLEDRRNILQAIIQRIELASKSLTLVLDKSGLAKIFGVKCTDDASPASLNIPIRLQRRGVETKLIIESPGAEKRNFDIDLCRLIGQARTWFDLLTSGEASTVREIAKRENVNEHEITRVLHLAFLSPRIVEDILDGRQAEGVSVYRLRRLSSIPFDWAEQVELLENLQ
jgi:DNA invertase Pin-like site-specific DNA recombinase